MSGDNSRDRDVPRAPPGAMPLDPFSSENEIALRYGRQGFAKVVFSSPTARKRAVSACSDFGEALIWQNGESQKADGLAGHALFR